MFPMKMGRRIGLVLCSVVLFLLAVSAWGDDTDVASQRISLVICSMINLIQLTAGAIAAIVIIFAGVRWVMSGDDVSARNGAKTTIIAAFVGIVIIAVGIPVVNLVVGGVIKGVSCNIIPGADLARAAGGVDTVGKVENHPEQNLPNLQIADISAGQNIGENMGLDLEVTIKNAGTADALMTRHLYFSEENCKRHVFCRICGRLEKQRAAVPRSYPGIP